MEIATEGDHFQRAIVVYESTVQRKLGTDHSFPAIRLLELIEHPVQGNFDLAHLQAMHLHMFQDGD